MENYTKKEVTITGITIPCLEDQNGLMWYPIKFFYNKILLTETWAGSFNKTELKDYMKPMKMNFTQKNIELKAWFINEWGLIYLLENMKLVETRIPTYQRQLGLDAAKIYFGIKVNPNDNIFTRSVPDYKKYDEWTRIVFETDSSINNWTIWRRCPYCQNYYPDTERYFTTNINKKTKIKRTYPKCLMCSGKILKSEIKDINKLKKYDSLCIFDYYKKKKYVKIFIYMKETNAKYSLDMLQNKIFIRTLCSELENKKDIIPKKHFNIITISEVINVPPNFIKESLDNVLKIGYYKPEDIHLPMTELELKELVKENFKRTLSPADLSIMDYKAIIGVITKRGLILFGKEEKKLKYAKVYKFTPDNKLRMKQIITRIKRMGE